MIRGLYQHWNHQLQQGVPPELRASGRVLSFRKPSPLSHVESIIMAIYTVGLPQALLLARQVPCLAVALAWDRRQDAVIGRQAACCAAMSISFLVLC